MPGITPEDVQKARTTGFTLEQALVLFRRVVVGEGVALYGSDNERVQAAERLDYVDLMDAHQYYVQRDISTAAYYTHGEWSEDDRLPFQNVYVRCVFECPLGKVVGLQLSRGPDRAVIGSVTPTDSRPAGLPYYQALVLPYEGPYELQTLRGFIGDEVSAGESDMLVRAQKEYRENDVVIGSWATSFARFIVNGQVKVVEVDRDGVGERGGRKSFHTIPVPELREFARSVTYYVGQQPDGSGTRYNGSWWVCAHWRVLRSEKFQRNEDGSFKRVWVREHVRGRGKLVKQTWVIRDHKPAQAGDA